MQAAQLIYDSEDKLSTLKHLAQNFPRYAGALARRVSVNQELLEELAANQPRARGGVNVAWLNGVTLDEKDLNPFRCALRLLTPKSPFDKLFRTAYYVCSVENATSCCP